MLISVVFQASVYETKNFGGVSVGEAESAAARSVSEPVGLAEFELVAVSLLRVGLSLRVVVLLSRKARTVGPALADEEDAEGM